VKIRRFWHRLLPRRGEKLKTGEKWRIFDPYMWGLQS
jgi:hypothetical protein